LHPTPPLLPYTTLFRSQVTHYKASWVQGAENYPEPTWPLDRKEKGIVDKEFLRKDRIEPWQKPQQKGVGIHVGMGRIQSLASQRDRKSTRLNSSHLVIS